MFLARSGFSVDDMNKLWRRRESPNDPDNTVYETPIWERIRRARSVSMCLISRNTKLKTETFGKNQQKCKKARKFYKRFDCSKTVRLWLKMIAFWQLAVISIELAAGCQLSHAEALSMVRTQYIVCTVGTNTGITILIALTVLFYSWKYENSSV